MVSVTRRSFTVLLPLLLASATQACAGPTYVVQQYSGEVRPRDTIAVIRVNGKDPVLLDSLDGGNIGVQVAEDARLYVEVLPGMHTVGIVNAADMSSPASLASFRAEPGKFYRPLFAKVAAGSGDDGSAGVARVYEVTESSDALLRDVTLRRVAPASH